MVSSLHDGMNLVAKEFVAAREDNDGSFYPEPFRRRFSMTHGAIVVNPYDIEKMADAIKTALEMPLGEQQTN